MITPPGWYPDPFLRHEQRWFNGQSWTTDVADGTTVSREVAQVGPPPEARPYAQGAVPQAEIHGRVHASGQVSHLTPTDGRRGSTNHLVLYALAAGIIVVVGLALLVVNRGDDGATDTLVQTDDFDDDAGSDGSTDTPEPASPERDDNAASDSAQVAQLVDEDGTPWDMSFRVVGNVAVEDPHSQITSGCSAGDLPDPGTTYAIIEGTIVNTGNRIAEVPNVRFYYQDTRASGDWEVIPEFGLAYAEEPLIELNGPEWTYDYDCIPTELSSGPLPSRSDGAWRLDPGASTTFVVMIVSRPTALMGPTIAIGACCSGTLNGEPFEFDGGPDASGVFELVGAGPNRETPPGADDEGNGPSADDLFDDMEAG